MKEKERDLFKSVINNESKWRQVPEKLATCHMAPYEVDLNALTYHKLLLNLARNLTH